MIFTPLPLPVIQSQRRSGPGVLDQQITNGLLKLREKEEERSGKCLSRVRRVLQEVFGRKRYLFTLTKAELGEMDAAVPGRQPFTN